MSKTHDDEAEAVKAFSDRVNAVIGGRWLGVIVNIDDEGNVHVFRTTWQFPHNKYIGVIGLLATDLSNDIPNQPVVEQIPMEDFLSLQRKLQEKVAQGVGIPASIVEGVSYSVPKRDDDPVHGEVSEKLDPNTELANWSDEVTEAMRDEEEANEVARDANRNRAYRVVDDGEKS